MSEKNVFKMAVAQYVRMSTDYQQYSTANQMARIEVYAAAKNLQIVKTYLDEGRSGLSLRGRPGLQSLLSDVAKGTTEFDLILVYDVSRWGRFQDADEGAHYEFICRAAGKRVVYCAEHFENDGSPFSGIVKGLKRIMAGEYSRELSDKVFAGQCRLVQLGYHVGGRVGYGLRRMLIDGTGKVRTQLEFNERKALQTDRVVIQHGPQDEIDVVRQIFHWFVDDRLYYKEIVDRLIFAKVPPPPGIPWTKHIVRSMLKNEKYLGHLIYNRVSVRLSSPRVRNPKSEWLRYEHAFPAIIDESLFAQAQTRITNNPRKCDPERLLAELRALFREKGKLSHRIMLDQPNMADPSVYGSYFGSLQEAYKLVGFGHQLDYDEITERAHMTRRRRNLYILDIMADLRAVGLKVQRISEYRIQVGHRFLFSLVAMSIRSERSTRKFTVAPDVNAVLVLRIAKVPWDDDYFLIPKSALPGKSVCINDRQLLEQMEAYRCPRSDLVEIIRDLSLMRPAQLPDLIASEPL
jgi:DNA invertase Pin-like site-specific DNA recombinase